MSSRFHIKVVALPYITCVALLICSAWSEVGFSQPDPREPPGQGRKIFLEKCANCHSLQPTAQLDLEELARSQGPTLDYAGSKFQPEWLEKWLVSPYRLRQSGYLSFRHVVSTSAGDRINKASLPAHPALSPLEAKVVANYLSTLKRVPNSYFATPAATSASAQIHFEKILGCGSCHQARPSRGGLSGPELYTAVERLTREWTTAYIAEPNYWNTVAKPIVKMRGEQLTAISDYIFDPSTEKPATVPAEENFSSGESRPLPAGRAELIYQLFCSQCHGIQGDGKGINAPYLFVSPRNHTSPQDMGMLSDDRIYAAIRYGGTAVGKSALMPSWGGVLRDDDIKMLVEYLRTLSGTGATRER